MICEVRPTPDVLHVTTVVRMFRSIPAAHCQVLGFPLDKAENLLLEEVESSHYIRIICEWVFC